jgi:hypothetical protein
MNREESLATVAASLRWELKILSPLNHKSVKGEAQGYLQAMLYLSPATEAGGKTLCPHSTPACREGCLAHAGRNSMPKAVGARLRRTLAYLNDREQFMRDLVAELRIMQRAADDAGMTLAVHLNGTTDIRWEEERIGAYTVFDLFDRARFADYTRFPPQHRHVPPNWHLTYSLADHDEA